MKIIRNNSELALFLNEFRLKHPKRAVGFVPTMGALHEGHMSLISEAKKASNLIVFSIFVNPTQFNDSTDLAKYPRTEQADLDLLEHNGCDLVFIPSESDIYPDKTKKYLIKLNGLDKVMEGKYRNGHFDGVCMVVERFFHLVNPDFSFFGKKDFQQVAIIKHMVKIRGLKTKIISCPIKREPSGLAMSSRNSLLSDIEKKNATILSLTLKAGIEAYQSGFDIKHTFDKMMLIFNSGHLKLEYLEIVDNDTLSPVTSLNANCSICIAAYCGSVRLIDNIQFTP